LSAVPLKLSPLGVVGVGNFVKPPGIFRHAGVWHHRSAERMFEKS
jgi:hypothetical protein